MKALDRGKYIVLPIGITREGQWRLGDRALDPPAKALETGRLMTPSADPSGPLLVPADLRSTRSTPPGIDVIFPVLHGTFGEDGTVQGLLEMANVPYVGAGVLASATGMDKDVMKRLFRDAGLSVVPWILVLRSEWKREPAAVTQRVLREFDFPVFVKPANLGSSVGISKVHNRAELAPALNLAARYDRKIIVERGIDAREIECSVLGNDNPGASLPGEVLPINEFYDYEAKYIKEGSEIIVPAKLPQFRVQQIRDFAVRAFTTLDCAGMARIDFLLDRKWGRLYVNELNTIPGFTPISMYAKMWEASGVPYSKLLDRLIMLALERHKEKLRTQLRFAPSAAK